MYALLFDSPAEKQRMCCFYAERNANSMERKLLHEGLQIAQQTCGSIILKIKRRCDFRWFLGQYKSLEPKHDCREASLVEKAIRKLKIQQPTDNLFVLAVFEHTGRYERRLGYLDQQGCRKDIHVGTFWRWVVGFGYQPVQAWVLHRWTG